MATAQPYFLLSAATNNFTALGTKNLVGGAVINTNAAVRYLKFFNSVDAKGTAPTVGTTVPILTVQCAASTTTSIGLSLAYWEAMTSSGPLWIATTTGIASTDNTSVGAGDLYIYLFLE